MERRSKSVVGATSLLLSFCFQSLAHASDGFVAICSSVEGHRYDYGKRTPDADPSEEVFADIWSNDEKFFTNSFSFSFDGTSLESDDNLELEVNYIGPSGEVIASGLSRGLVGTLYTYALFPNLNKAIMVRAQVGTSIGADVLMGGVHELDCQFGRLN